MKGRIHTYLLLFPQSKETHTGHLHHLESNTRNITLGLTTATETGDEDFVVLIDKVKTTVVLKAQNFRMYGLTLMHIATEMIEQEEDARGRKR